MKAFTSVLSVALILAGTFFSCPALAQEQQQQLLPSLEDHDGPARSDRPAHLPPVESIDPVYLRDMERFYEECENHGFHNIYYDCRCLAGKYLEKRMQYGMDTPSGYIESEIVSTCPDIPGIAGYMYEQCINRLTFMRHRNYEQVCSCVGSTYAKNYAVDPGLTSPRRLQHMQTEAYLQCGYNANNTVE